jgi:hypothetical protein
MKLYKYEMVKNFLLLKQIHETQNVLSFIWTTSAFIKKVECKMHSVIIEGKKGQLCSGNDFLHIACPLCS